VETTLFLLLALTAGFCEEVIFRGYLQRQFAALTHAVAGGIVIQAILFGAAHGYQGWKLMLVIAVFGTMFGLMACWRRSLRPGMLAHFIQDGVGGVLGSRLMR
jgi:membrane protease YdiL (CAAX protease family)